VRKLADLQAHDCVVSRLGPAGSPWRLQGPRGIEEVAVAGPISADDFAAIRRLCLAGLGVALHVPVRVSLLREHLLREMAAQ
jgi:DNA-binding transcriptional LysR family regulator